MTAMNRQRASGVCAWLCGAIFLAAGATVSAAGECDANAPADPPAPDAATYVHYNNLPILILLRAAPSVAGEQPQISTMCLGKNPYISTNHPGVGSTDLEFDAATVTVTVRLGPDLEMTRWRASGGMGDQGGIRMVSEPNGSNTAKPAGPKDWPSCAGKVAVVGQTDISFPFKCPQNQFYKYELDFECKTGTVCKSIPPIDPQIVNRPHERG
jgi:hypothetical protein